jgi:hypothetical protein
VIAVTIHVHYWLQRRETFVTAAAGVVTISSPPKPSPRSRRRCPPWPRGRPSPGSRSAATLGIYSRDNAVPRAEPTLLRRWRISGDVPGRYREFPPFAEARPPFASSSSRSPAVEFGPSNAPSVRARRPSSIVSYEQSFCVPLTDAPVGFGWAPSLPPLTSASKKGGPKAALALHGSTSLRRAGDLKERLQDRWSLLVLVERAQLHREQRSGP